jgi:HD-GYP domain-containing protein (c-di-GMP phosphodiesterase class II)
MPAGASVYHDPLEQLNRTVPLREKLRAIHRVISERLDDIDRIAAAVYDPRSDLLKTFVESAATDDLPLRHHQARLSESPSLSGILRSGSPRVIDDLLALSNLPAPHTQHLIELGYASSYTMPMCCHGASFGLIFFDSCRKGRFDAETRHALDVFGHLIALVIIHDLTRLRTLAGAVKAARDLTHHRDLETGAHLDRMAYYARTIARSIAPHFGLDDAYVEKIFLFAPLHDVGKIGLPDCVLHKPGQLTAEEFELVKTHTVRGREIVDTLVADFGLTDLEDVDALRNIAAYHHEAINGTGYPQGLADGAIPLEARIVAVADVFDALTSRRCYKRAWSNDEAFAALAQLAGHKLDRDCVEALAANRAEVEQIQARFREDAIG